MTDKEKIKAIIQQYADKGERLLKDAFDNDECASTTGYWDGYQDCANDLLRELEDIQEEPKSHRPKITLGEATGKLKELLDGMKDSAAKDLGLSEEDYNKAIDECLYGKEPELVDDGDLPKEKPVSEQNLSNVESTGKNCKEHVSEDLEEAAIKYAKEEYSRKNPATLPDRCIGCYAPIMYAFRNGAEWQKQKDSIPISEELEEAAYKFVMDNFGNPKEPLYKFDQRCFKAGAKWQKEQFEKDYTNLCNGIATAKGFAVAMAYDKGVADAKEQMMANAVDVTVHIDSGGYPYIPQMELYDYCEDIPLAKEGDKYKVVLIKEV